MNIIVNGDRVEIASGATVKTLAEQQNLPDRGVAVAVNNDMVPRADWDNKTLNEGDDVVIIRAVCGG
ncbi:MAG: sulfur carrier protein ThiS [Paludibacteraceae bacterium]|nr:sulfur carrier protein ThiS [Paludibacteraceae bacterium]